MTEQAKHMPGPWGWNETPDRDGLVRVDGREMTVADFEKAEGLSVGGSLDLRDTAVESLPGDLSVAGDLLLDGAAVSRKERDNAREVRDEERRRAFKHGLDPVRTPARAAPDRKKGPSRAKGIGGRSMDGGMAL